MYSLCISNHMVVLMQTDCLHILAYITPSTQWLTHSYYILLQPPPFCLVPPPPRTSLPPNFFFALYNRGQTFFPLIKQQINMIIITMVDTTEFILQAFFHRRSKNKNAIITLDTTYGTYLPTIVPYLPTLPPSSFAGNWRLLGAPPPGGQ